MDKSERAEKKEARRMANRRKYAIETAKSVCNSDAGFTDYQMAELAKLLDHFMDDMDDMDQHDRYKTEVIHVPPTSTGSTGTSPISTGTTSSIPPPTNHYPAR